MTITKNRLTNVFNSVTVSVGGATDHGSLTGLSNNDHPIYTLTSSFQVISSAYLRTSQSFTLVSSSFLNVSTSYSVVSQALESHRDDTTIHFTEASIDHTAIQNVGSNTHSEIDTHIAFSNVHFSQSAIDHTSIQNIGTNTHAEIDTHIAYSDVHFSQSAIDHGSIAGLGDAADHPWAATTSSLNSVSSSIATDINQNQSDIAANTTSITTLSGAVAADVNELDSAITALSGVAAQTDINLDNRITSVSGGIANDVSNLNSSITTLSGVVASDINDNQADIASNTSAITTLSGATANDINELRYPSYTIDSSGDRTLSDSDHNTVIYMSGSSKNNLRIPPGLRDGFFCAAVQASVTQILPLASASLNFPSTTCTSRSLEEGAWIGIHSSSLGPWLDGSLEGA